MDILADLWVSCICVSSIFITGLEIQLDLPSLVIFLGELVSEWVSNIYNFSARYIYIYIYIFIFIFIYIYIYIYIYIMNTV